MRIEEAPPGWRRGIVSPAYIVGPILTLRHVSVGFTREELVRQFHWGMDEELQFWSGTVPSAPTFAQFEADVALWTHSRDPRRDRYAILDEHGLLIGLISYYNLELDRRQAELGIYIGDRANWGRGYGTEAILTLLSHLFRHTSMASIHLTTYAANGRAQACYRKCGFEVTGTMRKYNGRVGYYVDVQMRIGRDTFLRRYPQRPLTIFGT